MTTQAIDPIRKRDTQLFSIVPETQIPAIFKQSVISRHQLEESSLPIEYRTYLTIGGGIGSFIWVDNLIIRGVKPSQVMSIGMEDTPYGRYRRLCEQSQIPTSERLRSDSGATPDNIWGFPGYAVREAYHNMLSLRLHKGLAHLGRIFAEPMVDVYTPISGDVYASMDREGERIGWSDIAVKGRVQVIRKTDDGHYAVLYTIRKRNGKYVGRCVITRYLYISVGYPAARVLTELSDLRSTHEQHKQSMMAVNAYEKHNHVYDYLLRHGGTVIVRGRGIVASRILQRLYESREMNHNLQIIHVMRRPNPTPSKHNGKSRTVASHWELQPYNFPKSAWGGHLRNEFAKAGDSMRGDLLDSWGGTTTSNRRDWQSIIERGQHEGWYTILFGNIREMHMNDDDSLCVCIETAVQKKQMQVDCDVIIDATGLDADIKKHKLLNDLLMTYPIELNVKGRLDVTDEFEIPAMRTRYGRCYAAGAMTMGTTFAPVDSFLGLQYSAQMSIADLIDQHAPSLNRLTPNRSLNQWFRWMIGVKP